MQDLLREGRGYFEQEGTYHMFAGLPQTKSGKDRPTVPFTLLFYLPRTLVVGRFSANIPKSLERHVFLQKLSPFFLLSRKANKQISTFGHVDPTDLRKKESG